MKRRTRILLTVLCALIICGLVVVLFLSHEPPEPAYQGKPLSYWLTAYNSGQYQANHPKGPHPPTWQEADDAIRRMGTNAVPAFLRMLQTHDSKFKTAIWGLLQRQHFIKISFFKLGQNFAAFHGLCTLGSTARDAVPELIHLYETDSSAFAQQAVPAIMSEIGPAARPAIPMLLRAATHTNEIVRNNAVFALGQIHAEPERVVPALIKCLSDPTPHTRAQAARALEKFGKQAQPAVPALVELLRKETASPSGASWQDFATSVSSSWNKASVMNWGPPNPALSNVVENVLRSIDPEAAKAGVKW